MFLAAIVKAAMSPSLNESNMTDPATRELQRIQELRMILMDWKAVVGRREDFQDLIGQSARIVAATCQMSGKEKSQDARRR